MEDITLYHAWAAAAMSILGTFLGVALAWPGLKKLMSKNPGAIILLSMFFPAAILAGMVMFLMLVQTPFLDDEIAFYAGLSIGVTGLLTNILRGKYLQSKWENWLKSPQEKKRLIFVVASFDIIVTLGLLVAVLLLFNAV